MDNKALLLADTCAGDWDAVRPHLVVQMLRDQHARIEELEADNKSLRSINTAQDKALAGLEEELVKEAGRTAEQKLRADQMSQQHDTQAALNREARAALASTTAAQAQEPFGYVTETQDGAQNFFPAAPYLDNAVRCVPVYAAPQAQDVQRDAVGFKTADGVNVLPGDKVWVRGSSGIHESTVDKAVTNYMLFSSPIPVDQSYSSESSIRAAIAASATQKG